MPANDLRYAARTLIKSPVFLVTAVVTIALGIGASTAIFSVTNAVLLRPLPYKDPDRLVLAACDMKTRGIRDNPDSNENFLDLRNGAKTQFEDFAAVSTNINLLPKEDGTLERVIAAGVTTNFFRLMGARIIAGRDFTDADGQPEPAPPLPGAATTPAQQRSPAMLILSYEYWMRRYGGSAAVLGRTMPIGAQIIGVLAPRFELLFPPSLNVERFPDIWQADRSPYNNANRNGFFWRPVGRLRAGATIDRAQSEADLVAAEIRRNFPIYGTGGYHVRIEPMHRYMVAQVRPAILALVGAVIFLLLIACANVGNLLLVRASLRERELAVRAALGGNRWRLVRQMLAEAAMLAGMGTILGLGLAWLGIRELQAIAPANLPRLDTIRIDPFVLGITVLIGLAAAAIFGITPALRASRPDVMVVLRGGGRTAGLGSAGMLRNVVVVSEVALSFVLLIGSGLMFRSFLALQRIDLGFDPHHLLTLQLLDGRDARVPEERAAHVREILNRFQSIPGVESVTAATNFPFAGGFFPIRWGKEDALTDGSKYQAVDNQEVLPGYFETMRMPLIAGRTFTEADNSPKQNVVVIDQLLASKAFPNESPLGKRILIRIRTPEPEWVQIIGVVAHQRHTSIAEPGREQIYFAEAFLGAGIAGRWIIRTGGDPGKLAAAVRAEVAKLGAGMLITEMQTADVWVDHAQAGTRFQLLLIGAFAAIAALLAGVGLYGVLSTVVRQRTAEIGVRMALGAGPGSIFNLVVGHGLRLSAAGIVLGIVAAIGLTRAMTTMLVGIKPTDPVTYGGIIVLFLAIAMMACWIPGLRAAGLDPTVALREE